MWFFWALVLAAIIAGYFSFTHRSRRRLRLVTMGLEALEA